MIRQLFIPLLLCAVSAAVSLFTPQRGIGEVSPTVLTKGMSQSQILGLWGAPGDKLEYESKHEELWSYGPVTIRFFEGKVASWGENEELMAATEDSEDGETGKPRRRTGHSKVAGDGTVGSAKQPAKPVEQATIDQILSEIMQAAPDSGQESDGSPGGAAPGRPPNMFEQPGMPPPPPPMYGGIPAVQEYPE